MKLLESLYNIDDINNYADGYIVGVQDLSVNYKNYTLDDLKKIDELCLKNDKELFVSLNKNMHNKDLAFLKEVLLLLDDLHIKGIIYYDIAIVNIHNNLCLKTPLVWGQEHFTTNYQTMNFWYQYGSKYSLVSAEVTLDEIIEISKKAKTELIVPIFGYISMFVSKRHLVKNYLKTFSLEDNSDINYMTKEGNVYPIIDNKDGVIVYSSHILNGLRELFVLKNAGISYVYLNSFKIDNMNEIIKLYKEAKEDNCLEFESKINNMLEGNTDKGFLYKETVYKVK